MTSQGQTQGRPAARQRQTASSRRTAYHHGNLRPVLIEASIKILEELGVAGLTLREVARRAAVSHTAPYNHFVDREALLAAVATQGFRRLESGVASAGADHPEPRDRLRALARAYVDFALCHPALYSLMFGDEIVDRRRYPDLERADARTAEVAREIMAACLALSVRPVVSAETATVAGWALVHGLSDLLIHQHVILPSGRTLDADLLGEITEFFITALVPDDIPEASS